MGVKKKEAQNRRDGAEPQVTWLVPQDASGKKCWRPEALVKAVSVDLDLHHHLPALLQVGQKFR